MKKVKIISGLLASALVLTGAIISPQAASNEVGQEQVDVAYDFSEYNSDYDIATDMDPELLEAMSKADPRATVSFDLETGEIILEEYEEPVRNISDDGEYGIEPYCPEGLESVDDSGISTHEIIGSNDRRQQITSVNLFPYCAIAYLEFTYADGTKGTGTGAFVGDKTILTAGHCVYEPDHGKALSARAIPGGYLSKYSPIPATDVKSVNGWVNDKNFDYDYGIVKLSSSPGVGNFGIKAENKSNLQAKYMYCYGYPHDKQTGTLWYDKGIISIVDTLQFSHSAGTKRGQSGGPVVLLSDIDCIVGIHSHFDGINSNRATRITNEIINFVNRHI